MQHIKVVTLTVQDYFKMTGGFRSMMSKGGSSFNVSSNDLGISMMRNNRAKEIETKFQFDYILYKERLSDSVIQFFENEFAYEMDL